MSPDVACATAVGPLRDGLASGRSRRAADGTACASPQAYDHSNPLRIESIEEASAIDARIAAQWSAHPRRFVVEPTEDFLHKAARALALLREEVPECCRHHVRRFFWDDAESVAEP